MPNDVTIRLNADTARAKQNIETLEREVQNLRQRLGETSASARQASAGVDAVGTQSRETAGQVKIVSASFESLENRMHDSRRAALTLRDRMNLLNAELAENRKALLTADAAQKGIIDTRNRAIRVNQGLLRSEQQRNSAVLAGLTQERRELRGATQATGRFSQATSILGANLAAVGIDIATRGVVNFTRESIGAAVRVEGFRNSLTALYGDAQIASNVLAGLQELAQLPGITFESAVMGAVRLKTVGVEGERAEAVIREFGNAAALAGASTDEVGRSLVGFTQILSRGKVSQEELNQILENVPLIGNSIREAFGSIDAETIRDQLDAAGQSVQDFADILVTQLSMGARASADTAANAFSNLRNATFELQAAIGERLLPALADTTRGFTGFLEALTNLIEGNTFARKSAEDFTEAISGTTASVKSLLPELDEYIRRLDQQRRSRGGISPAQLDALNEAKDLYGLVSGAIGGNTEAIAELETRTTSAKNALDAANTEQERLKAAIDAVDPSIRSERDSIQGLNADFQANAERVSEAQSEYDQLNRVFTAVNEETETLKTSIAALEPPTATLVTRTRALVETVRELPSEITAVRDAFDVLAPTAVRVNAIFDDLNTSLVDTQGELESLDAVTQNIIQDLQDLEGLAHVRAVIAERTDVNNANLINQAVSEGVESLREYVDVMGEVQGEFETTDAISDRLTQSIRDQASAFDDLRGDVASAEISLGDIDETFDRIPDAIDPAIISMEDFETVGLRALRAIGDELSAFEGNLGGIGVGIDNLVTLFSNPANFAAGTLGAVIEGLANINQFAGTLGLPEGFFDDPVPGQAQVNPQNAAQNEQSAADQVHQAGIARNLNVDDPLAQIEILRENDPGIFQRHGTRGFIEQNFPDLVDVIYPQTTGASAQYNLYQRGQAIRAGAPTAGQTALAAAREAEANSAAARDAEAAAALSDIPEPDLPPEIADPLAEIADPLTTFSFTRDERATLAPYLTAVRVAENAIEDLTADSTPQEIADAYQDLVFAQTNLSNISEGIIRVAEETGRITGTAATNAITTLGLDLGDDLLTANNALISTLGDVGFEVIGGIENMREAIDVSDISSVFRMIPAEVEAAAEAEPEPEPEPEPAAELQSTFSFSRDQRGILAPLQGEVRAAQDFIDDFLNEDSSPEEIRDAYADLTDAETALFNQKVQFILLATGITDEARGRALMVEGQIFNREIRDANGDLVDAFEDIGFQLVNALTFTSGILRGSAAAIERIPVEVEAAAEETEAAAAAAETDDPLPGLRSTASLAANQVRRARTALGLSTSEADFETRRVDLIQAANVAYTAQIALLDALGLSEAEYQNRVEDAEDTRDGIIRRATTAVNTFAETRIKGEEDAAAAAEKAAGDATAAAEKAAREQMQIAERYQRDLQNLKDDAFDAEERRADRLVDLEQDTQDRITDIIRDANRSKEDIERDFQDDFQEITRQRTEAELEIISPSFSRHAIQVMSRNQRIEALRRESASELTDLGFERQRDLRDVGIREGRRFEDASTRQDRGERDINAQANATATAIEMALTPLLEQQAGLSPETIAQQTATAATESATSGTQAATAALESTNAVSNATAAMVSTDASVQSIEAAMGLGTAGDNLDMAAVEHFSQRHVCRGCLMLRTLWKGQPASYQQRLRNLARSRAGWVY